MANVGRRRMLVGAVAATALAGAPPLVRLARAETIKVGATTRSMVFFPAFAGQKKGFFEAEGLQIEIVVFGSSPKGVQAMISDSIQIGHVGPENVLRVNPRGANIRMLAGLANSPVYSIVAQAKFKKPADLKGAKLAVTNIRVALGTLFTYTMEQLGLKYPADYTLVEVPGTPEIWAAIQRGVVDGGIVAAPINFVAADKGFTIIAEIPDHLPEYQFNTVGVNADYGAQHRDVVVRYLKGYLRTIRWFYGNRDEAIALIQELQRLEPKHARQAWEYWTSRKILPPDGRLSMAGIRAVQELLKKRGDLGADVPSAEQWVDESFLLEAQRQLDRR
jgi:ABC-type nitrate/sulfonate/bicarbonate transport system substrate-binding protein